MEEFWQSLMQFASGFWWLIFPIAGLIGAGARHWDHLAQRRHKRRLAILKAKAELRTVTGNVRTVAHPREPKPITKAAPLPDQLSRIFDAHDAVTARWLDYELDVAKVIAFPTMSDGRQPLTAAFLRAKKVADTLRPASTDAKVSADQVAEYRTAVADFEVAFDVAEREARRVRDSEFTETERKRLATAKQLLSVAVDQAATPAERQVAYRRVRDELDGLIVLSDDAVELLEKKVSLELDAGAGTDS